VTFGSLGGLLDNYGGWSSYILPHCNAVALPDTITFVVPAFEVLTALPPVKGIYWLLYTAAISSFYTTPLLQQKICSKASNP